MVGVALLVLPGLAMFALGEETEYRGGGPGMMGPGMMGPGLMGPGMMGGGMMGPGMMGAWALDSGLSREQVEQLEQLHFDAARAMRDRMYANRDRMTAMHEAMHAFPVDEKAALDQWKAMQSLHEEMFKLHVATIAKAQQIVGKEKWRDMMEKGGGPGGSHGGPGMMRSR
jgi:Spy/CpxP family protein refolding chaperone